MNKKVQNASVGRPTVDDLSLKDHRDRILDMLSCWWGEVGWQLPRATTREELIAALEPLSEHPEKYRINRLLVQSSNLANAAQIREARQANVHAIQKMYKAQEHQRLQTDSLREAQMALGQASPAQIEAVKVEISKREAALKTADEAYRDACGSLPTFAKKLEEMEAGFAQDEMLMFIDKRFIEGSYAHNPQNLANAMAGLPFATDVRFMGAWQSYVRCSKLVWSPHHRFRLFETVQSIWKKCLKSKTPTAEFFFQGIVALSQTEIIEVQDPITNEKFKKKTENGIRSALFNTWSIWKLAIEKSLDSGVEPDRMPFLICANFTKVQRDPKTSVALVLGTK
jgi:hypothetical protein